VTILADADDNTLPALVVAMVYYFTSRCGKYTLYMGKDKYENEELIAYGLPCDVWFHVDDLSSAHVYCRLVEGTPIGDIPEEVLLDCCSLVKANSIAGCKKSSVYVIYTYWKNLKKTADMVEGQVSYHRPQNVRRVLVEKNNPIVNALNKTKVWREPDLYMDKQEYERNIIENEKARRRAEAKSKRVEAEEAKRIRDAPILDKAFDGEKLPERTEVAEPSFDDFF